MNTCIHSFITPEPCGRGAINKPFPRQTSVPHGWLCLDHLRQEQNSIPPKRRFRQDLWIGHQKQNMNDEQIVADIIATENLALGMGRIVYYRHGNNDPIYFKTLEPVTEVQ
jgi:hypothetical protein